MTFNTSTAGGDGTPSPSPLLHSEKRSIAPKIMRMLAQQNPVPLFLHATQNPSLSLFFLPFGPIETPIYRLQIPMKD
jgi:hypothetical protein